MASASATSAVRAPVFLRPRNFQWYWNSSVDPWAATYAEQADDWQKYTDVENEIIEDALNEKRIQTELDGNYIVNFTHQVQYQKGDTNRQRPIKRVQLNTDRSNVYLREDRFALPITLATRDTETTMISASTDNEQDALDELKYYGRISKAYETLELKNIDKSYGYIVEHAANGIMIEGAKLGKEKEAEWLAKQLLDVKHFGENNETTYYVDIPQPIGETCIYLYTKESFWYKILNSTLRNHATMSREQVKTMGPFCWLLNQYLFQKKTGDLLTVYRGLTLTDEERQKFMKQGDIRFTSFTSTSRNRKKAEKFGNTLLIFDLNVYDPVFEWKVPIGMNVLSLSDFPNEEEFTMYTGVLFNFVRYEYDNETKKHIIYLKASELND
ncbi:unnamed protein product [Rotaria sp. Silwood1]|nr:unnamed protein product [Rotaria sp. Silwood1]